MASVVEMQEERAHIFEQLKALNDRVQDDKRDFSAEEQSNWDKGNQDMEVLSEKIESKKKEERIEQLRRDIEDNEPKWYTAPQSAEDAFLAEWTDVLRGNTRAIEVGFSREDIRAVEKRDLLTSGTGANVIPVSFRRTLVEYLIENAAIRQTNATVLVTQSGEALRIPKVTALPTGGIIAEAALKTESDPTFAQVTLDAYKYARLVQLSEEFVQDEVVNVLDFLARAFGQALGNASGAHFVTGTGTNEPRGVQVAASAGVTGGAGTGTSVTGDLLIDLMHSVVSGYRSQSYWFMKDSTAASVRKLKTTDGQYIWQTGLQAGMPDLLLGRPVVTDPNMPAMAVNAKSILFGDFRGYFIRDVGSFRFERSDDFAFANDLVTFRAVLRTDGDLVDENAIKAYQNGAS